MTEAEYLSSNDPVAMLDWLRGDNPLLPECPVPPPSDRKLLLFGEAVGCKLCNAQREAFEPWQWAEYVAGAECGTRAGKAAMIRDIFGSPFRQTLARHAPPRSNKLALAIALDDGWTEYDYASPAAWLTWHDGTVRRLAEAIYGGEVECETCRGTGGRWYCRFCRGEWVGDVDDGHGCVGCDNRERLERRVCVPCGGTGKVRTPFAADRLPVLGDALEEAGCADPEILGHLRGTERALCSRCGGDGQAHGADRPFEWSPDPDYLKCPVCKGTGLGTGRIPLRGPHVRGCAVIDFLTGRT